MSKGNSAIKVLRTALSRVQKGWIQHMWVFRGPDGKVYVCLEGAMFGYCNADQHGLTDAQKKARNVVQQIIDERYPGNYNIPAFNDAQERTQDQVEEVLKLAIIRLETGGDPTDGLPDEEIDDLLEFMDSGK